MNDDMILFGERLKETRVKRGVSQKELAEAVGASSNTIIACEKALKKPSLDLARKIAAHFCVSLDWLCGLEANRNSAHLTAKDVIRALVALDSVTDVHVYVNENNPYPYFYMPYASNDVLRNWLKKFAFDWDKMKRLLFTGTIDSGLYNLWLDSQYKEKEYDIPLSIQKANDTDNEGGE